MDEQFLNEEQVQLKSSIEGLLNTIKGKEQTDNAAIQKAVKREVDAFVKTISETTDKIQKGEPISPREENKTVGESKVSVWISRILFFAALLSSILIFFPSKTSEIVAYASVAVVNAYLIIVLFIAAILSDKNSDRIAKIENELGYQLYAVLPTRIRGIFQFVFMVCILVFSFANIYIENTDLFKNLHGRLDCLTFSWGIISTITFEYAPIKRCGVFLFAWESVSGFILILLALGLLISRLSSYPDEH